MSSYTHTLHLDHFGHVRAEERVNPLRLSVTVHVQLDVCWKAAGRTGERENKEMDTKGKTRSKCGGVGVRGVVMYPVQGVQPGAVSEEVLQQSQCPLR